MGRWGKTLPQLLALKAQGKSPPALKTRPVLDPRLRWYYEHFLELSQDRRYDQHNPLYITTGEIVRYAETFRIGMFESFYSRIRLIDSIWMAERHKAQAAAAANAPKKKRPK